MIDRAGLLVIVVASVLLMATVALQPNDAAAAGTTQSWIEQIHAIEAEAWAAMDETVAPVAGDLESAATNKAARGIRDDAKDVVDDIYRRAKDDLEAVVDRSLEDPEVEDASEAAVDALMDHKSASEDEITARYDEWKFRFDAPPAEDVIGKLDEKLAKGLGEIAAGLDRYVAKVWEVGQLAEAEEERGKALDRLAHTVRRTVADLNKELADRDFDPVVQGAYADELSELSAAEAATQDTIVGVHLAWVAVHSPNTTATARPPATTTTTLAPAALLPATDPPAASEVPYMSDSPAAVVLSETLDAPGAGGTDSDMATVGLVRRIVDTQLPAGVSIVAAGPLVVLGLILDAILAAGTLMVIPWLVLGVYMLGLLRHRRLEYDA